MLKLRTASPKMASQRAARYDQATFKAAAKRHELYLHARDYLRAGWDALPSGLTHSDLEDIAAIARARGEVRLDGLCRRAQRVCAAERT